MSSSSARADLIELSATQAVAAMRSGAVSAEIYAQTLLDRAMQLAPAQCVSSALSG